MNMAEWMFLVSARCALGWARNIESGGERYPHSSPHVTGVNYTPRDIDHAWGMVAMNYRDAVDALAASASVLSETRRTP